MHEDYIFLFFFAILPSDNCFQYAYDGNIPLLEVFGRHKRHGLDDGIPQLFPHLDLDFGTLFMGSVGNVSHGDVFAERRGRNTRSDYTYNCFREREKAKSVGFRNVNYCKNRIGTDQFPFHPTHPRLCNLLSLARL